MGRGAVGRFCGMGVVGKLVKLGIAKKIYDEARKPENQRKAKDAWAKFQASRQQKR